MSATDEAGVFSELRHTKGLLIVADPPMIILDVCYAVCKRPSPIGGRLKKGLKGRHATLTPHVLRGQFLGSYGVWLLYEEDTFSVSIHSLRTVERKCNGFSSRLVVAITRSRRQASLVLRCWWTGSVSFNRWMTDIHWTVLLIRLSQGDILAWDKNVWLGANPCDSLAY